MTSLSDDTREGKGRVHPGPSPSAYSRKHTRGASAALMVLGAVVLLLGGTASSVFGTQAHQYSSPAALALVAALGSFLAVVAISGLSPARSSGVRDWVPQVLAGAGGLALAPWIVMANRYTDAPPGSEVVFFTTACWGAMLAIAVVIASPRRISRIGGTLLALAGAAAVVANWERPSSFSPFVRYAREESLMLVAGVLWVALVLVLLAASRRQSLPSAALRAALGGIGGALVLAALSLANGTLTETDFAAPGVVAFGIATAFTTAGLLVVLRSKSALGVSSAYLLVPGTMSLLLLLEQLVGMRGPNPLLGGPVAAAVVSTAGGLWLLAGRPQVLPRAVKGSSVLTRVSQLLAALALAAALVSLALPGMTATVQALRTDGTEFRASFVLYGYETAGTWLALGVALSALGLTFERSGRKRAWPSALSLLASAAAWPFVANTPLRTLTSFIPSEVQVDYGSEFARIDFAGNPPVLAAIALGGALVAVAVLLTRRPAPSPVVYRDGTDDDRKVDTP